MFVWFEDWSHTLSSLDQKKLAHGNAVVKVRASDVDPRSEQGFKRTTVSVLEINDSPFTEEDIFDYGERGRYSGAEIEHSLKEMQLTETAERTARTLFRFANLPETGFVKAGMLLTKPDGQWLIDYPLQDIDGWQYGKEGNHKPEQIHLDIFVDESLQKLARLLGAENVKNAEGLVGIREVMDRTRRQMREGMVRGKEG